MDLKRQKQEGSCREIWTEVGRNKGRREKPNRRDKEEGAHHEYVEMEMIERKRD